MLKPGQLIMPRGTGTNRIVAPGFLSGLVPFTRSQSSVITTAVNPSGTLVEYSANAPRFSGVSQSLIFEGQRTNAITNPRCLGVVVGTPGTPPTGWSFTMLGGITRTIVGSGSSGGVDYVDVRMAGTTSTSGLLFTAFLDTTANSPALTNGQSLGLSLHAAVVVGSLPSPGITLRFTALDGSRNALSSWPSIGVSISPPSTLTRYSGIATASNASTAFALPTVWGPNVASGLAVDVTLRIGWPQAEADVPYPSSTILPLAGATGASTRGHDQINEPMLEVFPGSVGTIIGRTTLDATTSIGSSILQIDNATINDRITLLSEPSSTQVRLYGIKAGAQSSALLGSQTLGQPFNWGFIFDGSNIVGCFNGTIASTVTNYPNALSRILVNGIATSGSNPMFGAMHHLEFLPYVVSSSQLQSLVANIPT